MGGEKRKFYCMLAKHITHWVVKLYKFSSLIQRMTGISSRGDIQAISSNHAIFFVRVPLSFQSLNIFDMVLSITQRGRNVLGKESAKSCSERLYKERHT